MNTKEIWLFIFFMGSLALSWPLMAAFGGSLPAYLFTAWLALIAVIFQFSRKAERNGG